MKKLIVANWKLNPQTIDEAKKLAFEIDREMMMLDRSRIDAVVCPPYVFLPAVKYSQHFSMLGAQNVAIDRQGAHTGEISVDQLKQFGVKYIIIGHSERRSRGETDSEINKKIKLVQEEKLTPILCVGYGTKRGNDAAIKRVISRQLLSDLRGADKKQHLAIAYEPVWAISRGLGTGHAAKPEHIANITSFIRSKVGTASVIYGGSVDAKNISELIFTGIDGALVGGASLVSSEFCGILKAFASNELKKG